MRRNRQLLICNILLITILVNLATPGVGNGLAQVGQMTAQALQIVYIVTNTGDSGAGSLRQAILDAGSDLGIMHSSRGSFHLGDQTRIFLVAGLGEMDLISAPLGASFNAISGFEIIR